MLKKYFPYILLGIYIILFVICAINPVDKTVWITENITVLIVVIPLVLTYKKFRFSNMAYFLMSIWIYMHTIGGHYTFKNVPFDFINHLFGWERNNYDRFAHFAVGFYAYAIAELLDRKKLVNSKVILFLFPIFSIFTVASVYEIFEWIATIFMNPEAGLDYVSAQGDIWDAQKDMCCDGLGAILATIFYFLKNFRSKASKI
ncbi:DUF2238 domain-containing protein [Nitrosophilus kaiyonis]|uniref:DUF2238 domain-containing protein n=1 Tax=Nitrosophilus kaiyonis TaxID=2930200 RepID=UPI00249017CE|nr:DUF2238 domain-containing protein [Nitrosophilus kaiyonis]